MSKLTSITGQARLYQQSMAEGTMTPNSNELDGNNYGHTFRFSPALRSKAIESNPIGRFLLFPIKYRLLDS